MEAFVNGVLIDNMGDLRRVCSVVISAEAGPAPDRGQPADDECLCSVDFEATAKASGMTLERDVLHWEMKGVVK
jgi:hypothetical protein